jgi:hypothetical protein
MKTLTSIVAIAALWLALGASPTLAASHKCGRGPCPAPIHGPVTPTPTPAPSPINSLVQFTVSDLQAAAADAAAQTPPDTRHGKCWTALIPIAQQWQSPIHVPTTPGLASAAQAFFDSQGALNQQLLPDTVLEACAETEYDLKIDAARLAALVGVNIKPIPFPLLQK